jgi:hypothetical protein
LGCVASELVAGGLLLPEDSVVLEGFCLSRLGAAEITTNSESNANINTISIFLNNFRLSAVLEIDFFRDSLCLGGRVFLFFCTCDKSTEFLNRIEEDSTKLKCKYGSNYCFAEIRKEKGK